MKATRWDETLFGSERASLQVSSLQGSGESLFSLLLKIESRLKKSHKDGSPFELGWREFAQMKDLKGSTPRYLSRYIE